MSITPVLDEDFESYIITARGEQVITNTYNQDSYINALRIDGQGTPLWNHKYAYRGGPAPYDVVENGPTTITYGNDGSGGKYFIAGTSRYWQTINHDRAFYMSIDKSGNIVDPYTILTVPGYTYGYDAIYDAASQEFIMSYTMGNNNLVGYPVASQIAVSRFGISGLTHNRTDYYYTPDATENDALGIRQNARKDSYILSSRVAYNHPYGTYKNMGILEIDAATAAYKNWNRYNINTLMHFGTGITSAVDPASGNETYLIAGNPQINPAVPYRYTRVISTDNSGNTCGAYADKIMSNSYVPGLNPEFYAVFICDDRFVPVSPHTGNSCG